MLPPITGCDPDILFGKIGNLVDEMNTNNIDFNEVAEAASSASERVQLLLEAIPVLETLPIDEIIQYATELWTDDRLISAGATIATSVTAVS